MKIIILDNYEEVSKKAAEIISTGIKANPKLKLGLATGSSPIGTYKELIRKYQNNEISFKDVIAFNLDEYVGLDKKHNQSYHYFMKEKFFKEIDIKDKNCFIPNGCAKNLNKEIKRYDNLLEKYNYTDIQILGIGENGHIAFNEPSFALNCGTSVVYLTNETINANSRFFKNKEDVPKQAITMGLKGILSAKKIILIASGRKKARAIKELIYNKVTTNNPATFLNLHNDVTLILDKEAARLLQNNDIDIK